MSCCDITLPLPDGAGVIRPGTIVRLGKFENTKWVVNYGWYSWGGNRPVCGWYLTGELTKEIKPLQYTDLDDMYYCETPSHIHCTHC